MSQGIQVLQQGPPPYVVFEQRPIEDRDASIKEGRLILKDIDYAVIFRHGSKDSVEKVAVDWLDDIDKQSRENLFPPEWAAAYRTRYKLWKDGQELAPMGFPIRQWAAITKSQAENLAMSRVLTVEDLAQASEEMLSRIGMGGRALKDKAVAWLESNKGNKGEELAALRAQNNDLQSQLQSQSEKIKELEAAIIKANLEPPRKRA